MPRAEQAVFKGEKEKETRNRKPNSLVDVGVLLSGNTLFRKKSHGVSPLSSAAHGSLQEALTDADVIARTVPSPASHPASLLSS